MNRNLAAAIVALTVLSGCWNGVPFQIDFSGKARMDYPEGDPRRVGSGTPTASESAQASGSLSPEKDDSLRRAFPDYEIPEGNVTVEHSVVLQKKGTYPARVEMFRVLDRTFTTIPETVKVRTQVAVSKKDVLLTSGDIFASSYGPDGVFRRGNVPLIIDYDYLYDPTTRDVELRVLSFDTTYDKTYRITTNAAFEFDGMPVYKPLVFKAMVAGILSGYSKPFILAPSERDLDQRYIPVEQDVQLIR